GAEAPEALRRPRHPAAAIPRPRRPRVGPMRRGTRPPRRADRLARPRLEPERRTALSRLPPGRGTRGGRVRPPLGHARAEGVGAVLDAVAGRDAGGNDPRDRVADLRRCSGETAELADRVRARRRLVPRDRRPDRTGLPLPPRPVRSPQLGEPPRLPAP